jgi:G3E family GTPase
VETTGLADPAPVAQTVFVDNEIATQLRLIGRNLDREEPTAGLRGCLAVAVTA